jgi:M6 family metalloprotease-like protein
MKKPLFLNVVATTFAVGQFLFPLSLQAVTAEDFGFGKMTVNGKPATGTFPLLVIFYELAPTATRPALAANLSTTMSQLIFNFFATPSVAGYYLENSGTQFNWQRAGVIGPVKLTADESTTLLAQTSDDNGDKVNETGLDSRAGFNYLLNIIEARTGYDFAQWDTNKDGSITQDELSIIVMGNNAHDAAGTSTFGANRPIGGVGMNWAVPGQNVTLKGQIASLDHHASFLTIAHELSHSFGTLDLYGANCFSEGLSLMSCTIFAGNDDRRTFHLDPWHKMQLGWLRPRIFTLAAGGVATIAGSQILSPDTPLILYDPAKGTSEYFMVEFRSNRVSTGFDHDANVTDQGTIAVSGMAIWHVDPTLSNNPAYHAGSPTLITGGSGLWNGMTPVLTWTNGTATATRLNTLGVSGDGRELTVEWLTANDTWVDFQYRGPMNGSAAQPFNAFTPALNAVSRGGIIKFKRGGSSPGPSTLTKPLDLQALGGPVTLGG